MEAMNWIADLAEEARKTFGSPGLAVAVVKGGEVVFAQGFGVRRLGRPEPVDEHSVFAIASISKSMTAACLGMLVDEGRVRWDAPVREYLPDFELGDAWTTREIRVRDLLMHNSGLREVSGGTLWFESDYSRAEVVRRLRYLKPVQSFRSGYAYQNVCFLVGGEVVRAVSGLSWDEFLQQRLFAPLGMTRSTSLQSDLAGMDNIASPHVPLPYNQPWRGGLHPVNYRNHDNVGPAASVNTTAWDLAQYLKMMLADGAPVLKPETVAELTRPQHVIPPGSFSPRLALSQPNFKCYGLGWVTRDYRGMKLVSHAGGVDGMRTLVTMAPAHGLGVVVLSNQEDRPVCYPLTQSILDGLIGLSGYDWNQAYCDQDAEDVKKLQEADEKLWGGRVEGTVPALPLEGFAGHYRDAAYGDILVEATAEGLTLRFSHTPAFSARLTHWHYNTFRAVWSDPYIPDGLWTFELDVHQRPLAIRLDQPNLLDVDFGELDIRRAD